MKKFQTIESHNKIQEIDFIQIQKWLIRVKSFAIYNLKNFPNNFLVIN